MPDTDIGKAVTTTNQIEDFSVPTATTDGTSAAGETRWAQTNWTTDFGYYKTIPELRAVIDAKATWTLGKGFETDKKDDTAAIILGLIKGIGKDTFNSILENMVRTYHIGGDAFAEIVRDKEEKFRNLKTLDPETMVTIADDKGRIIRYEQTSKVKGKKPKEYPPKKIFHLMRNRVADEIHGQSMIEPLKEIILMKNEAMTDMKRVMHRNIDPLWIIHADTDDTAKLAKIKSDWETIKKNSETWIVPKGVIVPELISVAPNASLNPITWIEILDNKIYEAAGVPKIIVGGAGGFTEAAVKIAYLAFQQTIEEEQLFIEEQVGMQLGLEIDLEFPASLENELLSFPYHLR